MAELECHEAASLFPLIEGAEFDALKADIVVNGQRETVKLYRGKILDGRNRYRACLELTLSPRTESVPDDTDPVQYVLSLNLHRRHLNESQRGMVAAKVARLQRGSNRHQPKLDPSIDGSSSPAITQEQAGVMLNVGESTVSRARKVIENAVPELVAAVERGEVSVTAAAKATELPEEEQREMAAEKAAPKAKRPRKTRKDKGKKRATDPAVAAALAEVETLLKRWESMRDLKKLVSEWEDEKRWTFCETLARLSRVLRQLSQDLKHHVPA